MQRLSIRSLMCGVALVALGMVGLRDANDVWAAIVFTATLGLLGTAGLGLAHRRGKERAWCLGFALFGSAYMLLAFLPWSTEPRESLATTHLLGYLTDQAVPESETPYPLQYEGAKATQRFEESRKADAGYSAVAWKAADLKRRFAKRTQPLSPGSPKLKFIPRFLPGVEDPYAFARIGHCLFAWLVGLLGGAISSRMYVEAPRPPEP